MRVLVTFAHDFQSGGNQPYFTNVFWEVISNFNLKTSKENTFYLMLVFEIISYYYQWVQFSLGIYEKPRARLS